MLELDTPSGRAHVQLHPAERPWAALVLGHGAGGGITAKDLVTASETARAHAVSVALVEQPYRVAGRRSPPPAGQLDAAWIAVVAQLRAGALAGLPLILGGRSSGARVACRSAPELGAAAVLCLAFPLQPPRRSGASPAESRQSELDRVGVPTLVVQGVRDPFGIPTGAPQRRVCLVAGDHSLRSDLDALAAALAAWLVELEPPIRAGRSGQAAGAVEPAASPAGSPVTRRGR